MPVLHCPAHVSCQSQALITGLERPLAGAKCKWQSKRRTGLTGLTGLSRPSLHRRRSIKWRKPSNQRWEWATKKPPRAPPGPSISQTAPSQVPILAPWAYRSPPRACVRLVASFDHLEPRRIAGSCPTPHAPSRAPLPPSLSTSRCCSYADPWAVDCLAVTHFSRDGYGSVDLRRG